MFLNSYLIRVKGVKSHQIMFDALEYEDIVEVFSTGYRIDARGLKTPLLIRAVEEYNRMLGEKRPEVTVWIHDGTFGVLTVASDRASGLEKIFSYSRYPLTPATMYADIITPYSLVREIPSRIGGREYSLMERLEIAGIFLREHVDLITSYNVLKDLLGDYLAIIEATGEVPRQGVVSITCSNEYEYLEQLGEIYVKVGKLGLPVTIPKPKGRGVSFEPLYYELLGRYSSDVIAKTMHIVADYYLIIVNTYHEILEQLRKAGVRNPDLFLVANTLPLIKKDIYKDMLGIAKKIAKNDENYRRYTEFRNNPLLKYDFPSDRRVAERVYRAYYLSMFAKLLYRLFSVDNALALEEEYVKILDEKLEPYRNGEKLWKMTRTIPYLYEVILLTDKSELEELIGAVEVGEEEVEKVARRLAGKYHEWWMKGTASVRGLSAYY